MKIEDIDVNKVALFVEQEMERRLSWAANALTVEDRPPRAIDLRDADVIEADMGKSEAARAVHIIHAFVAGSYSVPMSVELAFRFVWRWIYAPPFISTTGADGLGWDDMAIIPIGDDGRAKELAFLLRSVRSYFAPKNGQERERVDASKDTLDDDIDLVTAGQRRLSIPQRRAWGRVAKAALSARKEIVLLRAEVADLERTRMDLARKVLDQANELADLERKIGWLADDIRQKDAALTEANANLRMVEMEPGLAWRWQGDGYDDPASLACPVVMSAETLREFVAARDWSREVESIAVKRMKVQAEQHVASIMDYEKELWRADRLWDSASKRVTDLEEQLAAARAEGARNEREALLAVDSPFPLLDVLSNLVATADHLHSAHDCDHQGYEDMRHNRDAAVEAIDRVRARGEGSPT